jgi:DNA (cytosine-5)-methyltransferase 1
LKKNIKLLGVDIFSGVGGMSIGAEMAGIKIAFAVENNIHAADTFQHNHNNTTVINEDIRKVDFKNLLPESPFILFGGPPCQGFSISNTKTRISTNPNNALFTEYLRSVEELNPEWLVFENVQGFQNFGKGVVLQELETRLKELGYISKKKVLWASDYGVPQHRNRFFLIANRLGVDYYFPDPIQKKVSVGEAISDLPKLSNGDYFESLPYSSDDLNDYTRQVRVNSQEASQNFVSRNKDYVLERYRHIKAGQNWQAIPSELMTNYSEVKNTHSGIYKRLDPNQPSVVISNYRKNMLIHPFEDRGLSVREAARLQSFPDDFIFKGSLSHIQQQIGNAVPPLLAYHIFKSIISFTDAKQRVKHPLQRSLLEV